MTETGSADPETKEITCIICPNGCNITVTREADGSLSLEGAQCKRGEKYATAEFVNPTRMLITTMRVEGGELPVIPVRSREAIPKGKMFAAMDAVNATHATAPVTMGDVLIPDLLGTGIDVIASRDMKARNHQPL